MLSGIRGQGHGAACGSYVIIVRTVVVDGCVIDAYRHWDAPSEIGEVERRARFDP